MAVHHVLIKASTQIQLSSAGCYQMETMVILEEKKKKKSFCKLGAYIYVCIWQSCRPYQSKMLHLEWHSSKISLCFYLPTAHSLLELRACLGFGAVEPSTSCNMKKKTVFLTERGNSRRLRGMCRAQHFQPPPHLANPVFSRSGSIQLFVTFLLVSDRRQNTSVTEFSRISCSQRIPPICMQQTPMSVI